MGRIKFYYLFILIGIISCSQKVQERSTQIIQEVEREYAPDGRTAIFSVKATGSNPIILQGETNIEKAKSSLLTKFQNEGIGVLDEITVLPEETLGNFNYGLINVSVANLRGDPKHSAELVTQALLGTPVTIFKEDKGWLLIQTPDKYIAWTNSGSLERINLSQLNEWKNAKKIIYLNTHGYSFHHDEKERVSDLVAGNVLVIRQEFPDAWEVEYPDGRQAMVLKDEAADFQLWNQNLSISANSIARAAKDLMGIPYLWGGTSTKGLDCSGFTKTVYLLHGFVLPRDASQQVQVGELIDGQKDFSKLEVGDLLFFGRITEDGTEKVVHVGLWLGNHQFIHASGDVHISSLDSLDENFDDYNYERYLRAKRIIGANTGLDNTLSELFL